MKHPAKYTDIILEWLACYLQGCSNVLDPFAGTGKLRQIDFDGHIYLNELEPEWAVIGPADTIADALHLPYADDSFDAICTSPTYGNRMADHHNAKDGSPRNTYRHVLGRPLHPANSGQLQWGKKYQEFHALAWKECSRVLKNGGKFILNISDHIRDRKEIYVSTWHIEALEQLGFEMQDYQPIPTPRLRYGANGDQRVGYEIVCLFVLWKG